MALRRQETEKEPRHKKPKDSQAGEEKTFTEVITVIGESGGGGGSISEPPGPTSPREPGPEVRGDSGGGRGPRNAEAAVERRLTQRAKQVLSQHPDFGQCSRETLAEVQRLLEVGETLQELVTWSALLSVFEALTDNPAATVLSGQHIPEAAEALHAVPEIIRGQVRNAIDMAYVSCSSNGKMSGAEQGWWKEFRTLFR